LLTIPQAFILVSSKVPELQYTGAASISIAGILQVVGVFVFSLDQTGRILAYTGGRVFHFGEVLIILYLFVRLQNREFLKRKCMSWAGIYICATLAGLSFISDAFHRLWCLQEKAHCILECSVLVAVTCVQAWDPSQGRASLPVSLGSMSLHIKET
jgi:drug/metabolite transporter superfamily protein YnfA